MRWACIRKVRCIFPLMDVWTVQQPFTTVLGIHNFWCSLSTLHIDSAPTSARPTSNAACARWHRCAMDFGSTEWYFRATSLFDVQKSSCMSCIRRYLIFPFRCMYLVCIRCQSLFCIDCVYKLCSSPSVQECPLRSDGIWSPGVFQRISANGEGSCWRMHWPLDEAARAVW